MAQEEKNNCNGIIDIDIFITALRGNAESAKHLSTLKGKAAVSIITELELFVGAKTKLQNNRQKQFSNHLTN